MGTKAIKPPTKIMLVLLIGGIFALYGSVLSHEHDDPTHSTGCPCVHADKVEWHMPSASLVGLCATSLSRFLVPRSTLALTLSLLPARARSPPIV